MDAIVHFEIPYDDRDRAERFYKDAFGWNLDSAPGMAYTMVQTTQVNEQFRPTKPGAINGGMLQRQNPIQHVVITINVASIDEAAQKIEALGGKMIREKKQVSTMGYAAYFEDTEGNVIGLWETNKQH